MNRLWKQLSVIVLVIASFATHGATVVISVGNGGNYFSPSYFTLNPCDTVKWVWATGFHNTSAYSVPATATSWFSNISGADSVFYYVPTVSGLYNYTCTHHSGMDGSFFVNGCTYPRQPIIYSATTTACTGDSILLSSPSQIGCTYHWIRDGVGINNGTDTMIYAKSSGGYKLLVNRCGVDSVSTVYPIVFHSLPAVSFVTSMTGNGAYSFTNTTVNLANNDYVWVFSDGSPTLTSVHANHIFTASGNHVVTLKATDIISSCTDSFTTTLNVSLGIDEHPEYNQSPVVIVKSRTLTVDPFLAKHAAILIYNAQGKRMYYTSFATNPMKIDCAEFSEGHYFYRLIDRNGKYYSGRFTIY